MVYFFSNLKNIKIGYTSGKVERRLHQLNTGSDVQLYCIGYIQGDKSKEKELHDKFSKNRIRHNGEWFVPTQEMVDYINDINEKPNCWIEYNQNDKSLFEYFAIR